MRRDDTLRYVELRYLKCYSFVPALYLTISTSRYPWNRNIHRSIRYCAEAINNGEGSSPRRNYFPDLITLLTVYSLIPSLIQLTIFQTYYSHIISYDRCHQCVEKGYGRCNVERARPCNRSRGWFPWWAESADLKDEFAACVEIVLYVVKLSKNGKFVVDCRPLETTEDALYDVSNNIMT